MAVVLLLLYIKIWTGAGTGTGAGGYTGHDAVGVRRISVSYLMHIFVDRDINRTVSSRFLSVFAWFWVNIATASENP